MGIWEILVAAGIPSVLISTIFSLYIKHKEKKDAKREEEGQKREEQRHKFELMQLEGVLASMSLGEATALALKNGHTNGETERALKQVQKTKTDINHFLRERGVDSIN